MFQEWNFFLNKYRIFSSQLKLIQWLESDKCSEAIINLHRCCNCLDVRFTGILAIRMTSWILIINAIPYLYLPSSTFLVYSPCRKSTLVTLFKWWRQLLIFSSMIFIYNKFSPKYFSMVFPFERIFLERQKQQQQSMKWICGLSYFVVAIIIILIGWSWNWVGCWIFSRISE